MFSFPSGRYAVPADSLQTPPKQLMCRPICRPWVDDLKKKLCFNPHKNVTFLSCLVDPDDLQDEKLFKRGKRGTLQDGYFRREPFTYCCQGTEGGGIITTMHE